jgi:ketosteroid isomerase-like protein
MKKTSFPTAQDAEAAFYEALERGDLEAMMEVWADDEEVVCVHPGGPRLAGYEQVRAGWAAICRSGQRLRVHLTNHSHVSGMMLAVHSVHESILVAGEKGARHPVIATNVFMRTASGWRMILHHASPAPSGAPEPATRRGEPPKILH